MQALIIFCITILELNYILCDSSSKCSSLTTCGSCIGYSLETCVWCAQDGEVGAPRCQSEDYQKTSGKTWCDQKFIQRSHFNMEVTKDLDWLEIYQDNKVQFRPQNIKIKVKPGIPVNFTVAYKPALHYPLDVYYLIDNSDTMQKHKDELQKQANKILDELKISTNNVRFGIGTFVEKSAFPYVNPTQYSYSYQHHLTFTDSVEEFQNTLPHLNKASSNLDDPEAGIDALMQVMVCEEELQWRNKSSRIIILFTDNTYHSAGDGKMLGIMAPNDMKCHLDKDFFNSKELEFDYPSVSQINKVAYDGKFTVIFAAISSVKVEYEQLAKRIIGANYAELADNSNVMAIILKAYSELVRSKKIMYESDQDIEISMDQECTTLPKTNCESTFEKPIINVTVTLTVKSCPTSSADGYNKKVVIYPIGLDDKLIVDVEVDCQCECERPGVANPAYVKQCSSAGYLQCGICNCDVTRSGDDCRCERTGDDNSMTNINKCKPNVNDTAPCSGRGKCICGKCEECKGSSGNFCQYDDTMCPYADGKLCAGHGECRMMSCNCFSGWKNADCACTKSTTNCVAPYSNEICSGHGECECGACVNCQKVDGKDEYYKGEFCDLCEDCDKQRCKDLEAYAVCNFWNEKSKCDEGEQTPKHNSIVRKVPRNEMNLPENSDNSQITCEAKLKNDSILIYKFFYKDHSSQLIIQNEAEEPIKANLIVAISSAVGTVLLIGLLTLIGWKILVDWLDKREYEKFSDEAKAAGFQVNENPIYTAPEVRFNNPIYRNR